MFQSTPPRGGRHIGQAVLGSTLQRFNPRPRAGGDPMLGRLAARLQVFQSTPPRGGRPTAASHESASRCVSIHAPARGATVTRATDAHVVKEFQSTPPRRGRLSDRTNAHDDDLFQSTPPRGGRLCCHKLLQLNRFSPACANRGSRPTKRFRTGTSSTITS